MASVERRERENAEGKKLVRYLVRWRDPSGQPKSESFTRKAAAERFRDTIAADLVRGQYIDPDAGNVLLRDYAADWLEAQTFDRSTYEMVEIRLRLHVLPVLGSKALRQVKPSTIQAWLRGMSKLSTTYQKTIFANVSTIFSAAVDDELLAKNPCAASSVTRPKPDPRKVIPWERARVLAVRDALPERYSIVATIAAGLGLRQGEVFGLSPDDVDFLRGKVEVQRQVKLFGGSRLVFALPKGRKTRTVPLPSTVRDKLAEYLTRFPAHEVTLPWETTDGKLHTVALMLYTRERKAMNRNYFNPFIWKEALRACKVPAIRENGCHALRHFYASTLLDAGESIKAVSEYLGHSDAGFTLKTYTHLMPSSDERTRLAIDAALGVTGVYHEADREVNAEVRGTF